MRRVILPILALSLAATPALVEAQTPRQDRGRAAVQTPAFGNPAARALRHRDTLGLTAEQVARLEQLRTEIAAQNEPLLEQLRAARAQMPAGARRQLTDEQRARMEQRREERLAQLTPEQRQEVEQRREEMQQMRERMAAATPEQRRELREEMRQRMEQRREALTPEQRAQMRERMQEARSEAKAHRPRGRAMSPEARERMRALEPTLRQLRENGDRARQQVEAVLTDEQAAKLRELQPRRGDGARGRRAPRLRGAGR